MGGLQALITLALTEDIEMQAISAKTFRVLSGSCTLGHLHYLMVHVVENHTKVVVEGGLPPLICLLSYSHSEIVVHDAIQTLLNLADNGNVLRVDWLLRSRDTSADHEARRIGPNHCTTQRKKSLSFWNRPPEGGGPNHWTSFCCQYVK